MIFRDKNFAEKKFKRGSSRFRVTIDINEDGKHIHDLEKVFVAFMAYATILSLREQSNRHVKQLI